MDKQEIINLLKTNIKQEWTSVSMENQGHPWPFERVDIVLKKEDWERILRESDEKITEYEKGFAEGFYSLADVLVETKYFGSVEHLKTVVNKYMKLKSGSG